MFDRKVWYITIVVIIAERFHLFPYRTQKLSFLTPKVLVGTLTGRIGHRHFPVLDRVVSSLTTRSFSFSFTDKLALLSSILLTFAWPFLFLRSLLRLSKKLAARIKPCGFCHEISSEKKFLRNLYAEFFSGRLFRRDINAVARLLFLPEHSLLYRTLLTVILWLHILA